MSKVYGYCRCSTDENKQDISRQVRELKEMGFGREFRSIGLYSTTISWNKGEQMKYDSRTNSLIIR